ncbi:hypothetical protein XNC1_3220 [Xenorhabdus nematophila ATCC 19061]|uniref:Uncharacterized protein n=1 Tax=Xenorhabdus nematophila (strain ATCC 19061 / DSM 3370 / CCUG 14189 / LMG 1036 / NCIMB 9965 / AN6) TaxID=406817 RepID=D3VLE6_XENNA|nr:hypothetical protein XNC1_3220 [Xenorhabdus nematophila ATCC 19061]
MKLFFVYDRLTFTSDIKKISTQPMRMNIKTMILIKLLNRNPSIFHIKVNPSLIVNMYYIMICFYIIYG